MSDGLHLGANKTAMQVHPLHAKKMMEVSSRTDQTSDAPPKGYEGERVKLIAEAESFGTIPIPAGLKGLVSTGVKKLKGENQEIFLDKLGERMAFERTGVRLYDALIAKHKAQSHLSSFVPLDEINEIRNQELEHFRMLQQCMVDMGADPTGMTPSADLTGVMGSGLVKVCTDARVDFASSLEAILIAELTDNACWENLISLAEEMGRKDMAAKFRDALDQEEMHLRKVKLWIKGLGKEDAGLH